MVIVLELDTFIDFVGMGAVYYKGFLIHLLLYAVMDDQRDI